MQLIFSTVGKPRGRGRIERFFQTVNQLFLHELPGYIANDDGKPTTKPTLSLREFKARFHDFLLDTYLRRPQKELGADPEIALGRERLSAKYAGVTRTVGPAIADGRQNTRGAARWHSFSQIALSRHDPGRLHR